MVLFVTVSYVTPNRRLTAQKLEKVKTNETR